MKMINKIDSKIKNERGFTLVELLASIAVAGVIGGIITSILFSSLRGTSKTNILTSVRQSGSYALTQMEKMLRSAQQLDRVGKDPADPLSLGYDCQINPTPTPAQYKSITITSDQQSTTFICDVVNNKISSMSATKTYELLDSSAVDLIECYFTCAKESDVAPPIIGVTFTLTEPGRSIGLPIVNEKTVGPIPIPFQTSVVLRNY